MVMEGFTEEQVPWQETDYRFTVKNNTLYAFLMKAPQNRVAVLRSLGEQDAVRSVRLLGEGPVPFAQEFGVLTVKLPEALPTPYTNCLAIELHK